MDSEEEMSDSDFSEEEESDNDSSTNNEESYDDSKYESSKKRKSRPSSSKSKKPQSKPLISISSEEEYSDFPEEKKNPKGVMKKKSKNQAQTRKKQKKIEETGKDPEETGKESKDDKQTRTLEAEHSLDMETMEETLRATDTISALHINKDKQITPGKVAPSSGPPPEALNGFMKSIEWLIDGNKKTADEYKKLCNRVLILETINIGEGNTMADYIKDLKNTIAKAEDIRDA